MMLALDERIDWFRVITELQASGFGYRDIARRIGVDHVTVAGWKAGAEPRHSDGERLLALWCEVGDHPREQAPRISVHDFRA